MKLFLDSANLIEIEECVKTNAITGITTNPSLVAKEERELYTEKILRIARIIECGSIRRHLSVEAISIDPQEILEQSTAIHKMFWHEGFKNIDLFLKVPVTFDNLAVITELNRQGVQVNATACMNALQARMVSDAGAKIVSFFYNRIKDEGEDPDVVLRNYAFDRKETDARIICGSIRSTTDVKKCRLNGADIVTASFKVINEMTIHPQTTRAIAQFQKDIDAWLES